MIWVVTQCSRVSNSTTKSANTRLLFGNKTKDIFRGKVRSEMFVGLTQFGQ